jgi:transposase
VKERALKLLAEGNTYDQVARVIGCSKNTVIKWKQDAEKAVAA